MSCGQIALQKAGIEVEKYYASEIKDIAIKVTKHNFPNTIHIGDVRKVSYSNGYLKTEFGNFQTDIDIVIFGSPCQSFSIAMKTDKRTGLKDKEKSGLFLECYRILKEVNPTYFLMENVSSMNDSDRDYISGLLGVQPIRINSKCVSPVLRDRLYWTNIPNVSIPSDIDIKLQDILTDGYTNREKGRALLVSDSRPPTTPVKMFHRYYYKGFGNLVFKDKEHFEKCADYYDKYTDYDVYREFEQPLVDEGWDVIVFVPSKEEDSDRITCGNALISTSK